jgi:hypothetical protein
MPSEGHPGRYVTKSVNLLNLIKMKKLLFAVGIGFIFINTPGNGVYAQNSKKVVESKDERDFMPSIRKLATMENPALAGAQILGRNYVSTRAIRDFMDRFDKVENAMWFSTPEGGFEVYFIQDGYGDRIMYDKKGRWKFTLINYGEGKLPRDIRAAVKSIYFDLDITLVEEIQTIEGIDYIVYLEFESLIKVVKVNKDGELEVLQELTK